MTINGTLSAGITLGTLGSSVSPLTVTVTGVVEANNGHKTIRPPGYDSTAANQIADQVGGLARLGDEYGAYAAGLIQGLNDVHLHRGVAAPDNTGKIGDTNNNGIYFSPAGTITSWTGLIEDHKGISVDAADRRTGANSGILEGTGNLDRSVAPLAAGSLGATATFADVENSPGVFSYTVTLNNTGTTTIGTFWFAWDDVPDQDFMSAEPGNVGNPAGWSDLVTTHDYGALGTGYGIQWKSSSIPARLAPGGSLQFTFDSTETPSEMANLSIFDNTFPVTSSFVYIGAPLADPGFQLTVAPVCFCRGTLILTEHGEIPVEDLAIGDRVVTLSGEVRPVKWIGQRAYDGRFVVGNPSILPIRVAAGALADGLPARDLYVSPAHSLYIRGVLVAASHLVNGATITQETTVERLEYFHVELEVHDIIFADGVPTESYIDCDNRGRFQNSAEFALLYPDDDRPRWQFCAPVVQWESEELNPIREALLKRAEALGYGLALDPDLHLVVDGTVIRPNAVDDHLYRFVMPAGSAVASLISRSTIPAEIRTDARDRRRLGVAVERVVLYDADLRIDAQHGHAGLNEGFHDDEPTHRWTGGVAPLPETWLRAFPGEFTLEVHLISAELPYRLPPPPPTPASSTERAEPLAERRFFQSLAAQ